MARYHIADRNLNFFYCGLKLCFFHSHIRHLSEHKSVSCSLGKGKSVYLCVLLDSRFFLLCSAHVFKNRPIKHIVVFEPFACEKITKVFAQIGILRVFVKAKGSDVVEISRELARETLAQCFHADRLLLLHNKLLFLIFIRGFEALPGKRGPEQVEKHIP